jgi:hypothetical protein
MAAVAEFIVALTTWRSRLSFPNVTGGSRASIGLLTDIGTANRRLNDGRAKMDVTASLDAGLRV